MTVEFKNTPNIEGREHLASENDAFLYYAFMLLSIGVGAVAAIAVAKLAIFQQFDISALMVIPLNVFALLVIPLIACFVVVLYYPDIVLSVFVFTIYTNLSPILVSYFSLPSIAQPFVGLLSIIWLLRIFIFRDEIRGLQLPIILIGMYTLVGMITLVYARDFDVGYATLIDNLKDIYYSILVVAFIQKPKTLRYVIWALLSAGILMGLASLYQQFTGTFSNEYWGFGQTITSSTGTGYRLGGPIGDPNYYAMFMAVLVPLAIDRLWSEKNAVLRALAGWTAASCVITVLYTYSRGGFLALIFIAVFFGYKFRSRLRFVPVVLGVSIMFIVFQFLPAKYTDRVTTLLSFFPKSGTTNITDESIRTRASQNLVAIQMFLDHPIAGIGIANYDINYYSYARPMGIDNSIGNRRAHDLYLQIAAERGLLGLLAFATLVFVTFQSLYRSEVRLNRAGMDEYAGIASAIGVSLAGYLIASTFLHDAYFRYFWVLLGIAWSFPQLVPAKESKTDERNLRSNGMI